MAVHMKAWKEAMALLLILIPWFSKRGQLQILFPALIVVNNHVSGMERVITSGTIAKVFEESGNYSQALDIHKDAEKWLRANPDVDDFHLNLIAALTGQVDCYTNMGMPKESATKVKQAIEAVDAWPDASEDVKPRILAQIGELQDSAGQFTLALKNLSAAIKLAGKIHYPSLLTELRYTKAKVLWRLRRLKAAERELDRIEAASGANESQYMFSQILDLRGKLLSARGDPRAVEYLLQSYEIDLQDDNFTGAAISLLGLINLFLADGNVDRADERVGELERLVADYGLRAQAGSVEYSRGRIFQARGDKKRAYESFILSAQLDAAAGQFRHALQAREQARECLSEM
jgi:tetratricopeptide (TPR) repeat protein